MRQKFFRIIFQYLLIMFVMLAISPVILIFTYLYDYKTDLKRVLDVMLAAVALVILSPIMVIIAIAVHIKLGAPILFCQERPGLHGKPFRMFKFRTMLDLYDEDGNPLPDTCRTTPLGDMLRSTSLDELPELWNVLRGDMSLVGPRPLLVEYLPLYNEWQTRRHMVKPGITGLAQVTERLTASWDDKFRKDVYYVDNVSLWLDVKILLLTIAKVLRRAGTNQTGFAPTFRGSEEPPE